MGPSIEQLAHVPLFRGIDEAGLRELAQLMETVDAEAHTAVIREGDASEHPIYVLLSGSVDVLKKGVDGRSHLIANLTAPTVFGEIEILSRRSAIASVIANTDISYAYLPMQVFDERRKANHPHVSTMICNLATVLSARLAATDQKLADLFEVAPDRLQDSLGKVRALLHASWRLHE